MQIVFYGQSDQGSVRSYNQDFYSALPEARLFLLADGMGGYMGGEIAAQMAVTQLSDWVLSDARFGNHTLKAAQIAEALKEGICRVNTMIYTKGREDRKLSGMGTTLCLLYFWQQELLVAHVGDSRIYRLRGNTCEQMTQDDTLLVELLQVGVLETEEIEGFPLRHVLTKSVGSQAAVDPSIYWSPYQIDDLYLLCSDGLCSLLSNGEIAALMQTHLELSAMAALLVDAAKARGGSDNITVLLVSIKG